MRERERERERERRERERETHRDRERETERDVICMYPFIISHVVHSHRSVLPLLPRSRSMNHTASIGN